MAFIIDCTTECLTDQPCNCLQQFIVHLEYRITDKQRREIRYEGGAKTLWPNAESESHRVIGRNRIGLRRFDYSIKKKIK